MYDPNKITYFAETDFRTKRRFGIKAADRTKHVYVVGKTGMGKSTLLENMAVQDIQNGEGMAFIDPHGGTADKLLEYVPAHRIDDVIYFAPFDMEYPISFNVMEDVGYDKRHLVVSGLMSTFEKLWADAWSARMSYILSNTLYALLEYPDSTLLDINRMLVVKEFRKKVVENIKDPAIKSFWTEEFAKYTDRYTQEATPAIQNKIGQFVSNPLIRNIIGQPKSSFDIRQIMDDGKILIMNLSKGRIGEGNTNLLGSMLITKIYLSAMSRADLTGKELAEKPNFYFYVDEFQSFANKSFADILSEARKYKLNLTIAHQYVEQMEEEVREAVFGNVGTMIVFRVGSFDAEIFEKEFAPQFTAEDIVNLGFAQIYLKLMIDGIGSRPFSAVTLPPIPPLSVSHRDAVVEASRAQFGKPRQGVEEMVMARLTQKFSDEKKEGGGARDGGGGEKRSGGRPPRDGGERPRRERDTRPQDRPHEGGGGARSGGKKRDRASMPQAGTHPRGGGANEQRTTTPEPPRESQVSLRALNGTPLEKPPSAPQKPEHTQNRNELRDALKDLLGEERATPAATPKPVTAPPRSTPAAPAQAPESAPRAQEEKKDSPHARPEPGNNTPLPNTPRMHDAPPRYSAFEKQDAQRGPGEVPESELRRVIE